jgi:hypothetical protein
MKYKILNIEANNWYWSKPLILRCKNELNWAILSSDNYVKTTR